MEKILGIVGIVAFVVLFFVVVIYLQRPAAAGRREAWRQEANKLGFAFADADPDFLNRHALGGILETHSSPTFENIVSGTLQGSTVVVVEHAATEVGHGRSHHYTEAVCVVKLPGMNLPRFRLEESDWLRDAVAPGGLGKEIAISKDPAFSKAFKLRGRDEASIRQVFHPAARQAITRYQNTKLHLDALGPTLILSKRETIKPSQMKELIDQALFLANSLARPV